MVLKEETRRPRGSGSSSELFPGWNDVMTVSACGTGRMRLRTCPGRGRSSQSSVSFDVSTGQILALSLIVSLGASLSRSLRVPATCWVEGSLLDRALHRWKALRRRKTLLSRVSRRVEVMEQRDVMNKFYRCRCRFSHVIVSKFVVMSPGHKVPLWLRQTWIEFPNSKS